MNSSVLRISPITLLFLLAISCSEIPSSEELKITETEIRFASGRTLIHIDDMPGSIPVDEKTEFGAVTHFTGAVLSPDRKWLAVTTSGTSHSAGWLFGIETENLIPAAFQYGGSVKTGEWNGQGRYVIFIEESPAPGQTLSVTDSESSGSTVTETSAPVRLPGHTGCVPPETKYIPTEWDNGILIFEAEGERYRYNTATTTISSY
jgi:hypothetical protein